MNKCHQKSFGLKNCCVQKIWVKQNFGAKNQGYQILGQKRLVKIGSVTAGIFLIWTNVARTNVAWTNVTVMVGISSRCSQEPNFKVLSKSGN